MIVINTVTATRFSLNGIEYFKNYISEVAGNQLTVFNAYDRKDVKVEWSAFGNFLVDNVAFSNVADLQSTLLDVIYTRTNLGSVISGGGSFNKPILWNGGTVIVPTGYAGTVFNQSTSQFCPYTLVGVVLTITANATAQDILLLTEN